jgi:hypothetical protein
MTCHEFWNTVVEGTEPADHLRECPSCAVLVERRRALAAGLKQMAAERHQLQTPLAVEARLVQAFRLQAGQHAATGSQRWVAWIAAAAAVIVFSVLLIRGWEPQNGRHQDLGAAVASATPDPDGLDADFIPLPYGSSEAAIASVAEDADLVRVEVPRTALIALGVPVPVDAGARVEAVMALGADGVLKGVRILQ